MAKITAKEAEKLGRSELRRALSDLGVSRNDTRMQSETELRELLLSTQDGDGKDEDKPARRSRAGGDDPPARRGRKPPPPEADKDDEEPEEEAEEEKPTRRRHSSAQAEEPPVRTRRRGGADKPEEAAEPRRRRRSSEEAEPAREPKGGGGDEDRDFRNDVIQRLDAIGQLLDKLSTEVGGRFDDVDKQLGGIDSLLNEVADETLGPAEK